MNPFQDIAALFFPPVCAACGKPLIEGQTLLCNYCRWEMPLTRYWERDDNPLAEQLRSHVPIVHAAAFWFFAHSSPFRNLIHDFKYRDRWRTARMMGQWFGAEIASYFGDIDVVIPVPLHLRKRLMRGYNQSEYIAQGIGVSLDRQVDIKSVVRKIHTRSQASRNGAERWDNVDNIFGVRRPAALAGRHILLVDDVVTTGATILSLAETILRAVPDCRISIAALATSPKAETSKTA